MIPSILIPFVALVPYCSQANITFQPLDANGKAGRTDIVINMYLTEEKLKETLIHECQHIFWYKSRRYAEKDKIFGKPPWNEDPYAQVNKYEDWAVEGTQLILNGRPKNRKQRYIRRLLNKHGH